MGAISWKHTDPRGLGKAIPDALARAAAMDWPVVEDARPQIADLRALAVATMVVVDACSDRPPTVDAKTGVTTLGDRLQSDYTDPERLEVAKAVWRSFYYLAMATSGVAEPQPTQGTFSTVGGEPPQPESAGTAPWVVAVAVVAGITAQAAVTAYVADRASMVIDRYLERRATIRTMVQTQGAMLQAMADHFAAEAGAGKKLPLSDAEKALLKALLDAQRQAGGDLHKDWPSLFPDMSGTGGSIIAAGKSLGSQAILALAILAYMLLKD